MTESSSFTVRIIDDNFPEENKDFTFRGVLDADTGARVEIIPPNPQVAIIVSQHIHQGQESIRFYDL